MKTGCLSLLIDVIFIILAVLIIISLLIEFKNEGHEMSNAARGVSMILLVAWLLILVLCVRKCFF